MKSSRFLFLHLALASPVVSHLSVSSPDIRLGKNWSQAVIVFIVARDSCIVILKAQSIPKLPIPPKAFVRC